jgi:hypothetical protein
MDSDNYLYNSFVYSSIKNENILSDSSLHFLHPPFNNMITEEQDNSNSLYNENDNGQNSDIFSEPNFINKINSFKKIEEKSTAITNINIQITKSTPIPKEKEEKCDNNIPKSYTLNDIKQKVNNNTFKNIIEESKNDQKLKKAENDIQITNKKRKTIVEFESTVDDNIKYGTGRKKKGDSTFRKHNRYAPDNIIKKIKARLLDYLIQFVNKMIIKKADYNEEYRLLKKLNYKQYVDNMDKNSNLNFLQTPLKNILSFDISAKYSKCSNDWNKKIIESLLVKYGYDNIVMFALNMTYNEWINIFLSKKSVMDFGLSEKECEEFEGYLPKVNDLLEKIQEINDENYFSHFVFYLYNFERWFYNKKGRKKKVKKSEK